MKLITLLPTLIASTFLVSVAHGLTTADVWINEFHYDNDGGDVGEFVEIAALPGTPLSGIQIHLYNGSNGTEYEDSGALGASDFTSSGGLFLHVWEESGIQNGSPDGIALSSNDSLIQFLSYEGSLTATDGIAAGIESADIGESEPSDTPIGQSLQLSTDPNDSYSKIWILASETPRDPNSNQYYPETEQSDASSDAEPLPDDVAPFSLLAFTLPLLVFIRKGVSG